MKNKIKSLNELYMNTFYFYQYGMYLDYIRIIKNENKPYLENKISGEIIKGLANINKYIAYKNLEFEEV